MPDPSEDNGQSPTLSIDEVRQQLHIGRSKAYDLLRRGVIPSLRLGRTYVIPRSRFEAWFEGRS